MKTAIYIEDGIVQLVITPESEFEKNAVASFSKDPLSVKVFDGAFYDCRGGWVRQEAYYPPSGWNGREAEAKSLILRMESADRKRGEE